MAAKPMAASKGEIGKRTSLADMVQKAQDADLRRRQVAPEQETAQEPISDEKTPAEASSSKSRSEAEISASQPVSEPSKIVRLSVALPAALHTRLRMRAIEENVSMSSIGRQAIKRYLEQGGWHPEPPSEGDRRASRTSPRLGVDLPLEMRVRFKKAAYTNGTTMHEVIQQAIEEYVGK